MSTLYEDLVAAGVEVDHHESDLQFRWNGAAQGIYADHQGKRGADGQRPLRVSTFHSQRAEDRGEWWAEVPFAYDPFWVKP